MTSPTTSTYQLKGNGLLLARVIWVLLCIVSLGVLIAGLTYIFKNYLDFSRSCSVLPLEAQNDCTLQQQALRQLGLPLWYPAISITGGLALGIVSWILVGALIFWRQARKPFEFLFSLMLVVAGTFGFDEGIRSTVSSNHPALGPLLTIMTFLAACLLTVVYLFPNGQFTRGWLRWFAGGWIIIQIFANFLPASALNLFNLPDPFPTLINIIFPSTIIFAFVDRYRNTSDPVQRQQIKWAVASGSILAFVSIFTVFPWVIVPPGVPQEIYAIIYLPLKFLTQAVVAGGILFSILRYRLWDIDFIINRSLVYGSLTVLLALIFGGSLFIISRIVEGQNFVLAFGVTALIAGSSFNPTRRRIQRFVDQRFYNINIDYQKTPLDIPSGGATQVLRGTQFGVYQNLELIGRGGMAEVYKSTHPTLHKPVAIKILPDHLAAEEDFRKRFTREAQIVSKLEHPNIVRMFDSGENNGKHYMVMEYLTGKDLSEFIRANGKLTLAQALPLVQQIASALDYAHTQGLVHRDIKPSNVLLDMTTTNNIRAILTDFGIAKIIQSNTAMTKTGGMLGTFDYIAPEQIQESANVDGRADIYALGIMVFQMLTGDVPFKHNNPGALLIAHLTQPPPDACKLLTDLPEKACDSIQRAMAKKPDERFATASEFALALNPIH